MNRDTNTKTEVDYTKAGAWLDFPKVELHTHLDCSLRYLAVARLMPEITEAAFFDTFVPPTQVKDLSEFLDCVIPAIDLMQTRESIRVITEDLVDQFADDGVRYAEIRFAPHLLLDKGLSLEEIVETTLAAMHEAGERRGITCQLIFCTLRHYSTARGLEVVDLLQTYQAKGAVALDLAGDEAGFPLEPHIPVFRAARDRGLHVIAHAGEGAGPASVWEILKYLKPERLGHGVRSIEDPALLERLASRQEHLEVCPSCNIMTAMYPAHEDHPIDKLKAAGLSVGINTDGRGTARITLSEEYARLASSFGWGLEEISWANRAALAASFAPDAVRASILQELIEAQM